MTPDPHNAVSAAQRVIRLIRDLRRRNEAWADGETEFAVTDNPDVIVYDWYYSNFAPMQKSDDVLADVVAVIIAEEMGEESESMTRAHREWEEGVL